MDAMDEVAQAIIERREVALEEAVNAWDGQGFPNALLIVATAQVFEHYLKTGCKPWEDPKP